MNTQEPTAQHEADRARAAATRAAWDRDEAAAAAMRAVAWAKDGALDAEHNPTVHTHTVAAARFQSTAKAIAWAETAQERARMASDHAWAARVWADKLEAETDPDEAARMRAAVTRSACDAQQWANRTNDAAKEAEKNAP